MVVLEACGVSKKGPLVAENSIARKIVVAKFVNSYRLSFFCSVCHDLHT